RERVPQVKKALVLLASSLPEDAYKKPSTPTSSAQDLFKVSFYAVRSVEIANGATELRLLPEYRCYPNESTPKSPFFTKNDGGSGLAWDTERIVVFEHGGKDTRFHPKWTGQE